jgi:hypothetical protein
LDLRSKLSSVLYAVRWFRIHCIQRGHEVVSGYNHTQGRRSLRRQRHRWRDVGRRHVAFIAFVAFIAEPPEKRHSATRGDQPMSATLKVTHAAIGAEVRRGPYEVVVDGERRGSVAMHGTIELPVEPGRHTLQVRHGRNASSTQTFDAAEGEIVAFRCTGKRFLPLFLASFVVPSLGLKLVRVG